MARARKSRSGKRGTPVSLILLILVAAAAAGAWYFYKPASGPHLTLYFYKGESLSAVHRPVEHSPESTTALQALLKGVSPEEAGQGFASQIPGGVELYKFSVHNGIAIVDLSANFSEYGGGAARAQGMLAQIVYTATEFPTIQKVKFFVNGSPDVVLGGEGLVIDAPMGRADFRF